MHDWEDCQSSWSYSLIFQNMISIPGHDFFIIPFERIKPIMMTYLQKKDCAKEGSMQKCLIISVTVQNSKAVLRWSWQS